MVYAKIRNPEWFDYRIYEDDIQDNMMIDGGRDFSDINGEKLKAIKKMIDEYRCYDYEFYYQDSILAYLRDMLPKKVNGKAITPKQAHDIKVLLDSNYRYYSDYEESIIIACLSIIYGEEYESFDLKGCCQGEWVKMYAPATTSQKMVDYIEALYFATGSEIEVHDSSDPVNDASDIYGWTFYTSEYNEDTIKEEIAKECGVSKEDVVLYKFTGYSRVECYEKC